MFRDKIKKLLEDSVGVSDPQISFITNEEFGDYSTNLALTLAKEKKVNPKKLAEEIVSKIKTEDFNISVAGPGFINFSVKNDVLVNTLSNIDRLSGDFGKSNIGNGKLAIVEYSSPNIAKPFGVGHLRSTVIGDAIANLMEFSGYKVLRDNHLGDWGTQFGKVICAIKKWGDEKAIEESEKPVEELVKLYVKFHEASQEDEKLEDEARNWFKKLEDGDIEARRLWQKCVDWSWVEFDKIYQILGIKFYKEFNNGRGLGESFFETRMQAVIKDLEDKALLKVGDEGAKLVFFESDKYPPAMILKKDGATLYHTRDLATDKYRLEKYNPDLIINEVGSEQSLYFKQLFEIEDLLGWYKTGQRIHVGHGLFLMDGKKMSTRAGKTVKLIEVLNEAIERAKKLGNVDQKTAQAVGIGAIKYFDLSHHPLTNITFDWNKMLAMEGNSGPYIQYTYARSQSVVNKSTNNKIDIKNIKSATLGKEEVAVLRKLSQFDDVVIDAVKNYSPNLVCNYLYELASKFNTFYQKHKIIGSENELFRVSLTKSTGQVIKNGLKILGIEAPEKM